MSRQAAPASGAGTKLFWRSLEDHAGTPEFQAMVEREFPGETWEKLPPATRRSFLKVMGASMAMAGLAGCRWPKEKIVPFSRSPEYTPGNPLAYATSMEIAGVGTGLLVTSFDGRPIKIEGNPDHPASRGATDLFAQALVLELYDPSRSKDVARRDGSRRQASDWDAFESFAREHFGAMRGGATAAAAGAVAGSSVNGSKFRILSEASGSPSMAAMREALLAAYPGAVWHEYEPLSRDGERAGTAIAFGRPYRPQLFLDRADVVVCLDDDLLVRHPDAVRMSRDLMSGRSADSGRMNRLYAIESAYTNTGSVADHRFAVPASLTGVVAARLAEALADEGAIGPAGAIAAPFAGHPYRPVFVKTIARDLAAARGRCVLTVGPRQPAAVHALVHHLNAALGNIGKTIDYTADPEPDRASHVDSIRDLAAAIDAGSVETLLVLGGNPVYDAPVDLDLGARIARVPHTIRLGLFEDETSAVCRWHLPRAHTLESWGDVRAWDGTVSLMQPLILPLYGGRSGIEVLSLLVDPTTPRTGHEIVRSLHQANDEAAWRTLLERGVLEGSAWPLETPAQSDPGAVARSVAALAASLPPAPAAGGPFEVAFHADAKVLDGRFANNAWLQELPDPMTKLTWDNAAWISPETARALDVKSDEILRIEAGGRAVEVPAFIVPGTANGTIALFLGYGRTAAGEVGNEVGANVYTLRASDAPGFAQAARVTRTGRKQALATTQEHHAMDAVGLRELRKRVGDLVRWGDLETYRRNPEFAKEEGPAHPPLVSLWKEPALDRPHQWGMVIDLNSCTGCSACAIACQSENNVPVVGKEQVLRQREMHWLRIDRYFVGDPESPAMAHQPVACVHCENAPCEQVCPVAATVHSHEGLNQMVYNRCVGTRYCSNNCPYKVRRFNWFEFHKGLSPVEKMVYNPEVTVRSRGVMEKCTYCIQRIEAVKIEAKNDGRAIRDGEIRTACQQACPTGAIVFGDLADPDSRITKLHEHARSYGLLEELNTQPRTRYLARLRNPAPELAGLAPGAGGDGRGEDDGHGAGANHEEHQG